MEKTAQYTKKGIRTKNKVPLLPNPVSSDGFVTDDDPEHTLRNVMSAISNLSTQVAINEEWLASQHESGASSNRVNVPSTSSDTPAPRKEPESVPPLPPKTDVLPGLEDMVRARIAKHLSGVPVSYLPGTDEDSDQDDTPHMMAR